jgi:hypothetical protein
MGRCLVITLLAIALPADGFVLGGRAVAEEGENANRGQSSADEARRLMRAGKFSEAVGKLETSWKSSSNPEVLFDLAVCYERLSRDAEALTAFRTYQGLPTALRTVEAAEHIRLVQSQQAVSQPTNQPRHVVVPLTPAGEKCLRECVQFSRCGTRNGRQCNSVRFSCARSCPGARVDPGSCLATRAESKTKCVNDGQAGSMP